MTESLDVRTRLQEAVRSHPPRSDGALRAARELLAAQEQAPGKYQYTIGSAASGLKPLREPEPMTELLFRAEPGWRAAGRNQHARALTRRLAKRPTQLAALSMPWDPPAQGAEQQQPPPPPAPRIDPRILPAGQGRVDMVVD